MYSRHSICSLTLAVALAAATPTPANAQQTIGPVGQATTGGATDTCSGEVAGFTVRTGWWIDGIQLHCRDANGTVSALPHRGGTGGTAQTFMLEPGERLRSISGLWDGPSGPYIYLINFQTDRRTSPNFGMSGTERGRRRYLLRVPSGVAFAGIQTQAGQYLTGLSLVVRQDAAAEATALAARVDTTKLPGRRDSVVMPPLHTDHFPTRGGGARDAGSAPGGLTPAAVIPWNDGNAGIYCPLPDRICSDPVSGLKWQYVARGARIPATALNLGPTNQRVCRAHLGAPDFPPRGINGVARTTGGGCVVVLNGSVLVADHFEVLVGLPGNYPVGQFLNDDTRRMIPLSGPRSAMPDNALQASAFGNEQQAICIAINSDSDAGRNTIGRFSASTGGCLVVTNGSARTALRYEVLGTMPGGM